MPSLNDSQIEIISKDIKKQNLKSFAFSNELLDHICCRVEQCMENGSSFESALDQSSHLYHRKEIKRIKRNFATVLNYSDFINSFIIYVSLLFYLGSWIFRWGQVDWIGLVAFVLISVLHFRYILLFYSDNKLRLKKTLVTLSSIGFVLFLLGYLKRFLWLNFAFSGQHVMPIMLFSWLIISITGLVYMKAISRKKSNRLTYVIAVLQVFLASLSLSTFAFPVTMQYIPLYSTIIIAINIASYLLLYFAKAKGKSFLRLIIVSSSFMIFVYMPHKSISEITSYKVQFEVKATEIIQYSKLYLYLNYYKNGKETLVLSKKNDSLFNSRVIDFKGGNLTMCYVVLKDSINIQNVLNNSKINKYELLLNKADTVFSLYYNPNSNP